MKYKWIIPSLIVFCCACSDSPKFTVYKLPSGNEVKVTAIRKIFFSKDSPGLSFEYQTDCRIGDTEQLRKEAEMIWPAFRTNVEKAGLEHAVITAITPPTKKLLVLSTNKCFSFVVTKNLNGTWTFDSWQRDYVSEANRIAERYIAATQSGDSDLLEFFQIPEDFTAEELYHEKQGLTKILGIIAQRFGTVNSFKLNTSPSQISSFLLQSGTLDYWRQYPFFISLIYDVRYSLKDKGYLIFRYSIISDKLVINSIRYGLPAENPETKMFIGDLQKAVMSEFQHK